MNVASRPLSGVERLWLAAASIAPPFANQIVLEGRFEQALSDALPRWREAMRVVAAALPGSRSRLEGRGVRTRWVSDGPLPQVLCVDGTRWSGESGEGAVFLDDRFDARSGPISNVLLVRGSPARVVVRSLHAAMDGRGTLVLAEALMAALRGEEPDLGSGGSVTDLELASAVGRAAEVPPDLDCRAPVRGVSGGVERGVVWKRATIDGRVRRPLARVAVEIAGQVGERCRIDIPVDLRSTRAGLVRTGNLTGLVRLRVSPGDDPAALREDLRARIEQGEAADFVLGAARMRRLPLALMITGGRSAAAQSLARARFETSATISNLGRLDVGKLSAPGFACERGFFIPPGSPGLPLFITLTGGPHGLEVCACMPAALASHGRIDTLLGKVVECLQAASA